MKFLYPIDLVKNELKNATIHNLASAPDSPVAGQVYFDTTLKELRIYTGTEWDVVGKEYELNNDILEASGNEIDGLTYSRFSTAAAGVLSSDGTPVAGTSNLTWSGHFNANRINNLELERTSDGFDITGGTSNDKTLIFDSLGSIGGNLTLVTRIDGTVNVYNNLTVGGLFKPGSSITLETDVDEVTRKLILGPNATEDEAAYFDANGALTSEAQLAVSRGGTGIGTYSQGDLIYSDSANSLAKLAIGSEGQTLRVNASGTPEWTSGGTVDETFVLKFDGGTIEGTDLYTFDGSTQKTIDYIGGDLINIIKDQSEVTFDHDTLSTAYGTSADDQTTLENIELLNSLSVDAYGHVNSAEYRKLVAGTYLTITATADGDIEFKHDDTNRTNTTDTDAPGFNGTFDVIDSLTTNATGHVTGVNTTTITVPTETVLSVNDNDNGTWLSALTVSDHEITINRTDSTEATITVGELVIQDTDNSTGDLLVEGDGTIDNDLLVKGDTTITGDLTVNGTTTTLNTQTVEIEDNLIEINSNQTGTPDPGLLGGLQINRGEETDYQFVFVEQTDDFRIGQVGDLQPVLTRDEVGNLEEGDILVWDDTNNRAVGKTFDELALPNKYAASIAILEEQSYTITHNLNTTDVIVSLKDITTGSDTLNQMIYADIETTGLNTIQVSFGFVNGVQDVRVTVLG